MVVGIAKWIKMKHERNLMVMVDALQPRIVLSVENNGGGYHWMDINGTSWSWMVLCRLGERHESGE